ncbi:MAG TPA: hypothetical protein PLJ62_06670 [Thermoflexales bacterium]|nr:hypothetical protein [Thermoflexales bacterium]HQZ99859.1 hypothetical protein [Thermoflexales bacterium]
MPHLFLSGLMASALAAVSLLMPSVASAPVIGGCQMFPNNNVWNTRIDTLPVHPRSDEWVNSVGFATRLHPDFGTFYLGDPIGIPYTTVVSSTPSISVTFDYWDESDPGPYPIPQNPPIEGGPTSSGDRHVLIVNSAECKLYEMWSAYPQQDGSWQAGSGAVFDLSSNALRPDGWTSADAAGLPVLPALVRYDEAASGAINHALRFTAASTQRAYLWPARHFASSITDPSVPPMGARFRLKQSVDISGFPAMVRPIFQAMKTYGMFLADNGSNWFVSGEHDPRWDDDELVTAFRALHGYDFEVVDELGMMVSPDSGAAATARAFLPMTMRDFGIGW